MIDYQEKLIEAYNTGDPDVLWDVFDDYICSTISTGATTNNQEALEAVNTLFHYAKDALTTKTADRLRSKIKQTLQNSIPKQDVLEILEGMKKDTKYIDLLTEAQYNEKTINIFKNSYNQAIEDMKDKIKEL